MPALTSSSRGARRGERGARDREGRARRPARVLAPATDLHELISLLRRTASWWPRIPARSISPRPRHALRRRVRADDRRAQRPLRRRPRTLPAPARDGLARCGAGARRGRGALG
jgi:hypothetical protein